METMAIAMRILSAAGVVILLYGAILFFWRARRNESRCRSEYMLSFLLFMWIATYFTGLINPVHPIGISFRSMSVPNLILGNLYAILMLLYPIELLYPGWLTLRNGIRLLMPYVVVTGIYFTGLALTGESIRQLDNTTQMMTYLGEFNVRCRFILYLSAICYVTYLLVTTVFFEINHRSEIASGKIPVRDSSFDWLRYYTLGVACITLAYLVVLLYGTFESLLIHKIISLMFFCYVICKAGFTTDGTGQRTVEKA